MRVTALLYVIFLFSQQSIAIAQETPVLTPVLEEKIENRAGDEEQLDLTSLTEDLERLVRHPVNIHAENVSVLKSSGLITDVQLQALEEHIALYGKLIALEELQLVKGFSVSVIRTIEPFITCDVGELSGKSAVELVTGGEHYFTYRVQRVIENKSGYENPPYSVYKGSPFGTLLRYKYSMDRNISIHLLAEKDPGEEFFEGSNKKGFDFYSAHVAVRGWKFVKIAVAGDFQVGYGQGLTFNSVASGGFSGDPVFLKRNLQGIRPYASSGESGFQRGFAGSFRLGPKWSADAFLSYRKLDGNIRQLEDTMYEESSVSSFQTSGYHRTYWEISDRAVISERLLGIHIERSSSTGGIGITAVDVLYDKTFEKTLQPYNRFDFAGNNFSRAGVDFWKLIGNAVCFGEITMASNNSLAGVGGIMISADRFLSFSLGARYYPRNFIPVYSGANGQRSLNANENGIYGGMSLNFSRSVQLSAGYDYYASSWLTYTTNAPSVGSEFSGRLTWQPTRKSELYIRYRCSNREANATGGTNAIDPLITDRYDGWRFHAGFPFSKSLSGKVRIEYVSVSGSASGKGLLLLQDISWRPLQSRWQITLRYAVFDTEGYDARVYAYESDIPGSYSVPAYYYKGTRIYGMLRFKMSGSLTAWVKYGASIYNNREVIGSGYEEITGNTKSEIKLQLRYEFQ